MKQPKSEAQLQSQCYLYVYNNHPQLRGRLFATFQETRNSIEGGLKRSLGLYAGVGDMALIDEKGRYISIEMKLPSTNHDVAHLKAQSHFLINVPYKGYFCDNFEEFCGIVLHGKSGVDPRKVLDYLETVKTKTIVWNREKFE